MHSSLSTVNMTRKRNCTFLPNRLQRMKEFQKGGSWRLQLKLCRCKEPHLLKKIGFWFKHPNPQPPLHRVVVIVITHHNHHSCCFVTSNIITLTTSSLSHHKHKTVKGSKVNLANLCRSFSYPVFCLFPRLWWWDDLIHFRIGYVSLWGFVLSGIFFNLRKPFSNISDAVSFIVPLFSVNRIKLKLKCTFYLINVHFIA